jgi:ACS family hexuronate transporter-like MFS transporter
MPIDTKIGRYRWVICGLLFAATAINYVDRQIIGVLKPTLQAEYGWSETDFADIIFWFQFAYAISYLAFGRLIDKIGARWGYALAFIVWTAAHMAHAGVRTLTHFFLVRILLGLGEAGNFPAGIKAVTEWFPKKERAFAVGLFNAGANVGAIITPLIVPAIVLAWGWRAAFLITGVASLLWLVAWLVMYRRPQEHPRVSAAELAHIESDPADKLTPIPWGRLLRVRETWAYAAGKFLIDPIWWFFLFWLPGFFATRYGLDLRTFGPPLVVVYVMSDIGSIAGGWFSSRLMKTGMNINGARKMAMFACALFVLPVMFAMYIDNLWVAVGVVGLATAAHQGFSANLYTLPSDVFPRRAVGSVVGIGGLAGGVGGMLMAKYTGYFLDYIGSYTPIFIIAGSSYLLALLVVHLLSPRYELAKVD